MRYRMAWRAAGDRGDQNRRLRRRPSCWRRFPLAWRGIDPCAVRVRNIVASVLADGSILCSVSVPMLAELRERRSEILETARARGASRVRVFGSVARGDATDTSDIDFLVDLDEEHGLFDLGGLLMDLQDLLGHSVDVVTETGLRTRVSQRVLRDAVEL